MKRILALLSVFFFVICAVPVAHAFEYAGQEQVVPAQTSIAVDQTANELKKLRGELGGTKRVVSALKKEEAKRTASEENLAKQTKELGETAVSSLQQNAAANAAMTNSVASLKTNLNKFGSKVDEVNSSVYGDYIVLGFIIIVALVTILFVLVSLQRNLRREIRESATAVEQAVEQVVVQARDHIVNEVPNRTATAIRTLDSSPFEFEAAGHQVTYKSPAEGIAEGYYLTLHVPKDMAGDAAIYHRDHETNRGVARRNIRKTMQQYFEGKFDAPEYELQKKLIEHLKSTGEISYRKIS